MDILNVKVVWIDGKCYRKLPIKGRSDSDANERELNSVKRVPLDSLDDEDDYDDIPIQNIRNFFTAVCPVPQCLVGFIIGKKGMVKKQIEEQFSIKIKIPSRNEIEGETVDTTVDTDVTISGDTRKNVANAYRRISSILFDARWKIGGYTHFLSVPFNNEEIQDGFLRFKEEVLSKCKPSDNITEDMFVKEATLHLTITMLTLLNKREIENAKEILLKRKDRILQLLDIGRVVELRGVEILNDDPAMIEVLYGKIVENSSNNSLQLIADGLSRDFAEINYTKKEERVKLHVTLIKSKTEGGRRETFDGRRILEEYSDYEFGRTKISNIHLSVRYTGGSKYYTSSYVMPL